MAPLFPCGLGCLSASTLVFGSHKGPRCRAGPQPEDGQVLDSCSSPVLREPCIQHNRIVKEKGLEPEVAKGFLHVPLCFPVMRQRVKCAGIRPVCVLF